jgi:hypothetical protein
MTAVYRTGTGLYRQASGGFPPKRCGELTTADGSEFRAATVAPPPPRLGHGRLSRGAGAEAAKEVVD